MAILTKSIQLGGKVKAFNAIQHRYDDVAEMIASQEAQKENVLQFVADASSDPNITEGHAYYEYLGTSVGTLADYNLVSYQGSTPQGGSGSVGIENRYADITALFADQINQNDKAVQLVIDASADASVDSGFAYYEYLGTTVGDITDYRKLSEEESMDVDLSGFQTILENTLTTISKLIPGAINELNALIAANTNIENRYADITALLAGQGNQTNKKIQYVADASTDATVTSGYAYYEYLGTTIGDLSDYRKLTEQESLDVDLSVYQLITDNTLDTTDKTVPGAINELYANKQDNLTAVDGLTIIGSEIKAGGEFTENLRFYHSGDTGKYFQIDLSDPLTTAQLKSLYINLIQGGSVISDYYFPDYLTSPEEFTQSGFFWGGEDFTIQKISSIPGDKNIAITFRDTGKILIVSSIDAEGFIYEYDLRANWGTINNGNLHIPHVGWIVDYVAANGGSRSSPSYDDEEIAALVTTSDGDPLTAIGITGIPVGKVKLFLNGRRRICGDGVKTKDYYWSLDGGTTALALNAVTQGAIPYWNGSVAGFEAAITDIITFDYNV